MPEVVDVLLSSAIPALVLAHLFLAPYSKVEESFNTQAVHDILTFGIPSPLGPHVQAYLRSHYDHVKFPGSVPRTFVGAAVISGLTSPLTGFLTSTAQSQLLARVVLGLANALALVRFRTAVDIAFGRNAGRFYLAFVATQFHVIFYASRLLPNTLAFLLTTEALRTLMLSFSFSPTLKRGAGRRRLTLYLLAVAAIVFRSEVALLLATTSLVLFLCSGLSIMSEAVSAVSAATLIALPLTIGLDTFLWLPRISPTAVFTAGNRIRQLSLPLWPEAQAFFYNTVQGHASEWGTSPWHAYFSSSLPKLMLNPVTYLLCIPTALAMPSLRPVSAKLLVATLLFPAIYSILPHKEWRFIVYIVPALTGIAAAGASYIHVRREKSTLYRLTSLIILASIPCSLLAASALLFISSLNYPGGHALALLHTHAANASHPIHYFCASTLHDRGRVRVHLSNLALQTGVTRFQELHRATGWHYDKTDDPATLHDVAFWSDIDLIITESPELVIGAWDVFDTIEGLDAAGLRLSPAPVEEDPYGRGKVQKEILFPPARVLMGERRGGQVEQVLRNVAWRTTRGHWPHVRVKTRLFLLKRSSV